VVTGPWDPARAGPPGRSRILASDADRERAIDVLKMAFVHGVLTKDQLAVRTGHALSARTYGHLAAITADLAAAGQAERSHAERSHAEGRPPARTTPTPAPARTRLNRKVIAWGACAIVLPPALGAAFFTSYGGFLVMFLFTFIGTVLTATWPVPRRPGPASISGRR
jgi:DUF1707 SHOCT-like domain